MRVAVAACLFVASCGRSRGVADQDLGGLVEVQGPRTAKIDVERAAKDPEELGAALRLAHHAVTAALGPHTITITMATHVTEATKAVSDLDDKTAIEVGDKGAFHAVYTNSADYGREVTYVGGKLYLRPRYQRWHERAPETVDEPVQIQDQFYDPVAATWDLLAPGVEVTDRGTAQVAGRRGRKIELKPAGTPRKPAAEPLVQRKWREGRSIEALTGEVVLDVEKGVPLSVKLSGTIGFSREGRRFSMQISVQSDLSTIGQVAVIAVPASEDVVATPERLREVDDRDFLLQGIAPPLRKTDVAAPIKSTGSAAPKPIAKPKGDTK